MFKGEYRHNLDSKNRIIIPAKLRSELGATFVVSKGLDGCLSIYTNQEWERRINQILALPSTKREVRMYIRSIAAKAIDAECDSMGRIQLSNALKEDAKLDKSCVIIGAGDHVEIWASDAWDKYYSDASDVLEDVLEGLTEFM